MRFIETGEDINVELDADRSACVLLNAICGTAITLWDLGEVSGSKQIYLGLEELRQLTAGSYDHLKKREETAFDAWKVGDICIVEDRFLGTAKSRGNIIVTALDDLDWIDQRGMQSVFYRDIAGVWSELHVLDGGFNGASPLYVTSREEAESMARRWAAEMELHRYENHVVPGLQYED